MTTAHEVCHLRLVGVAGPLLRERPLEELARWRGVDTPLLCSDTKVGDAGAAPCPCPCPCGQGHTINCPSNRCSKDHFRCISAGR